MPIIGRMIYSGVIVAVVRVAAERLSTPPLTGGTKKILRDAQASAVRGGAYDVVVEEVWRHHHGVNNAVLH